MQPKTRLFLGGALVAVAAGVGIWAWQRSVAGKAGLTVGNPSLSIDPPPPLAQASVPLMATVRWTNTATGAKMFGVQGAVIQAPPIGPAGLVGGHWWTSRDALSRAQQLSQSDPAQYPAAVAAVTNRVVTVTVPAGGTGQVQLYSQPYVTPDEVWLFWIQPLSAEPAALLVPDPIGALDSQLPQAQIIQRVQVVG